MIMRLRREMVTFVAFCWICRTAERISTQGFLDSLPWVGRDGLPGVLLALLLLGVLLADELLL